MESLNALIQGMGLMHLGAGQAIMLLVSLLLLWLAIAKKFEPLLLLPIGFGGLLSNIPEAGLALTALESLLARVATYKEKTEALKAKIKKAMVYPLAVLTMAAVVTIHTSRSGLARLISRATQDETMASPSLASQRTTKICLISPWMPSGIFLSNKRIPRALRTRSRNSCK